jgi:hypothetical protein
VRVQSFHDVVFERIFISTAARSVLVWDRVCGANAGPTGGVRPLRKDLADSVCADATARNATW